MMMASKLTLHLERYNDANAVQSKQNLARCNKSSTMDQGWVFGSYKCSYSLKGTMYTLNALQEAETEPNSLSLVWESLVVS